MMRSTAWMLALTALVGSASALTGCGDDDGPKKRVDGGTDAGSDAGTDAGPAAAGFTVAPTTGLQTTEAGGQATFTVVLTSAPTSDVQLGVTSSDASEGTVAPAQLVFTSANWAAPQTVTLSGVDDTDADGAVTYNVVFGAAQSSDARYSGKKPADLTVTNVDNDSAGVLLTGAANLRTSEPDGSATFSVSLTTRPTANVVIGLSSSDIGEVTVSPASLTFTPDNWSGLQTVTLRGVNDTETDGPQTVNIVTAAATSDDGRYNALDVSDVTVINDDDDPARFIVQPTAGLTTREDGSQDSFTVRLSTAPMANVTVAVSSSDTTEATVYPASLTFTAQDWNSPHTVIVTGVDDPESDGNQPFTIALAAAVTTDSRLSGLDPTDPAGSNVDNDSPGITVTAAPGLQVNENGGQATFTVALNYKPTADVSIPVSSSNAGKATVGPATLVFTANNWNAARTVTITGVNNTLKDGHVPVNVVLGAAVSADAGYTALDPSDVTVQVRDDETEGLNILAASDFTTSENGKQTTFTVTLNSQPTANVIVPVVSSDAAEITVSPATVTFTSSDWNSPHTVTLTGVNDDERDGPQEVAVLVGATTSSDAAYHNLEQRTLRPINSDNDSPGVTPRPDSGLVTNEDGLEATFTVALDAAPTANVSFTLAVSDPLEASISTTTLVFTPGNWNAPQPVILKGLGDDIADGPQPYWVSFTPAVSDDPGYTGRVVPNVLAVNNDNDTPGVSSPDAVALTTTEAGGQATFHVVLDSKPAAEVTLPVASADLSEGTVNVTSLTFNADNWRSPQEVIVTGANDDIADGPQAYAIQFGPPASDDPGYASLAVLNVGVTNGDNDSASIEVDAPALLTVTEAVGPQHQVTFTVALNSEPTSSVTIPVGSSDTGEAIVSPASLVFTADNWNAPQTVTVTGQGDLMQDGDVPFDVTFGAIASADESYAAQTVNNIEGSSIDSDSPGIYVVDTQTDLVTNESGSEASFRIGLRSPADAGASVTVPLTINPAGEAIFPSTGTNMRSVTFPPGDLGGLQVVVVRGFDDAVADGPQPYRISVGPSSSTDPRYAGRILPSIGAINNDNDSAGLELDPPAPTLVTDEFGTTASFRVRLTSEPTGNVTLPTTSTVPTEGTVSGASLLFTPGNWASWQTVTLTGVNDAIADGSQPYFVTIGPADSTDDDYNNRSLPNLAAFNTDNDSPGITVLAPPRLATSEDGVDDTFSIRLNSEPVAAVTIAVASSDTSEATVAPAVLTFTGGAGGNWGTPQVVTVTGINDDLDDRDVPYEVTFVVTSADANYNARGINSLGADNADNDTAGFAKAGHNSLSVEERADPADPARTTTFTLRLRAQPTADVVVPLAVDDATELTVSPASLTFTALNWSEPQTITVSSVDELVADSNQTPNVVFGPVTSGDPDYQGASITSVEVDVIDNETASVLLSKTSVQTFEVGTSDTFTVVLNSEPSVTTTIAIISSDTTEAIVSPAILEFTATNWNQPQTVTVTGQQDQPASLDGDQDYDITLSPVSGGASEYTVLGPRVVPGENFEAFLSCLEVHTLHPTAPSGVYWLDPDRTGELSQFRAYCDMTTGTGGWTLLSWTDNSAQRKGPPYPGLAYCGSPTFNCQRGSGVPSAAAATALFDNATELGQGQAITAGATKATFDTLGSYEYAGSVVYDSLANLTAATGASTCGALVTGTYATLRDPTDMTRNDGVELFLNQGLVVSSASNDYASDANSYNWSIGNPAGYCTVNGTPPASIVGTWQQAQYGTAIENAAGSYSIWVR
jgi:large repetitive protein